VALNLHNGEAVRNAFNDMMQRVKRIKPEARINGITVQNMARSRRGREICIGLVSDDPFGPVITFGAGGTMIELIDDRAMELPPLNQFLARRLIERSRVAETLQAWRGASASGALLLLALNLLLLGALRLLERTHLTLGKARWLDGRRAPASPWPALIARIGVWGLLLTNLLVLAALLLWSLTRRWSFPALWPSEWSSHHWLALLPSLGPLLWQSLWLALLCAALSLLLAVLCLEALPARRAARTLWLVCLPLLLPQASLLFGLRLQTDGLGFTGIGPGWVLWSQLIFVFPYVYLCLHGPYRQFDERLTRAALTLGASPWGAWWRVKGPLLARPLLFAFGVGAAVSLAQYLPTLLFGGGRVVTITTEAVAIGSGLNRRLAGLYGLLQLLLPLFIYALALWLPRRINPALRP
jgi:putative thiamine transport system permease protein